MSAKILLGLIVAIVAFGILAEWYYRWIRRVQPVDNSDPFAAPDLDKYVADIEHGDNLDRGHNLLDSVEKWAAERGMTLDEYRDHIIEQIAKCPYPTINCLTQTELEDVAMQRFGLSSPRVADHAYHCRYCRPQVLLLRQRGPR